MKPAFWIVWYETDLSTSKKHDTIESARMDAEALARANRGDTFYILEAVECCVANDVQWEKCDDIPY
jgi:hypothetical protein